MTDNRTQEAGRLNQPREAIDTGAIALAMALGVLGIAASPVQLRHSAGLRTGQVASADQPIVVARSLQGNARRVAFRFGPPYGSTSHWDNV